MKPKLRRNAVGYWQCSGDLTDFCAVAPTPKRAYEMYQREAWGRRLYGERGWRYEQREYEIAELMDTGASRAEAECDTGIIL